MSPKRALPLLVVSLSALGLMLGPIAKAQTTYTITDLKVLPNDISSEGVAINASGQVTGISSSSTADRAFIYTGGALTTIGPLGNVASQGRGINATGQVVGNTLVKSGPSGTEAFLYSPGDNSVLFLPTLGGAVNNANAINDAGQVTGWAYIAGCCNAHAFLYTAGQMVDLGTLPANGVHPADTKSVGIAINASGQVVGQSYSEAQVDHAFLYSAGTMTDLGFVPFGNTSVPYAINATGQITGNSGRAGVEWHAFLYTAGVMTDLGTLPGDTYSSGYSINAAGQIVGQSFGGPQGGAFLYTPGEGMINLNTLIPSGSGWVLQNAEGINDAGQITGVGLINGQRHAFLLTPTPAKTPFASVDAHVAIGGRLRENFQADGRFTLGSGNNGINPQTEAVALRIGGYTLNIPTSSFIKKHDGTYEFAGKVGGATVEMEIRPVTADIFRFKVEGHGAAGLPSANPVTVVLTIGNDSGTTTVKADIDGGKGSDRD